MATPPVGPVKAEVATSVGVAAAVGPPLLAAERPKLAGLLTSLIVRCEVLIARDVFQITKSRAISRKKLIRRMGYSERLIGSIRRDCLDHVVVFGERHLRHLLNSYQKYYNEARTHLSLHKDPPIPRAVKTVGRTLAMSVLGGLHHQYFRA